MDFIRGLLAQKNGSSMPLKQDYDVMFERNVAIIASRRQEILLDVDGELYEGFVCGLDDLWLQIYGHSVEDRDDDAYSWRFVLINKDKVNTIRTTGRDVKGLPEDTRKWVDQKVSNFSNSAEKFLSKKLEEKDDK